MNYNKIKSVAFSLLLIFTFPISISLGLMFNDYSFWGAFCISLPVWYLSLLFIQRKVDRDNLKMALEAEASRTYRQTPIEIECQTCKELVNMNYDISVEDFTCPSCETLNKIVVRLQSVIPSEVQVIKENE